MSKLSFRGSIAEVYLLHTPWPCRGGAVSQKSRTWRQRRGSQQKSGCLAPQTPAGSGSSALGSGGLSSSWQTAAVSLCGGPNIPPCLNKRIMLIIPQYEDVEERFAQVKPLTHKLHYWWVWWSQNPSLEVSFGLELVSAGLYSGQIKEERKVCSILAACKRNKV